MDRDAKNRIIRDIDPSKGIVNELEDKMGHRPNDKQRKAIQERVDISPDREVTDKRREFGDWRIKVGKDQIENVVGSRATFYNPVTDKKYYKHPKTGKIIGDLKQMVLGLLISMALIICIFLGAYVLMDVIKWYVDRNYIKSEDPQKDSKGL